MVSLSFAPFVGIFAVQLALMGIGIGNHVAFADEQEVPTATDGNGPDGGNGTIALLPKFDPQFMSIKDRPPKGSNVYYGEQDGICGWWNGSAYQETEMKYANPFEVQDEYEEGVSARGEKGEKRFCLYQFHRAALQPVCGEQWYPNLKLCAMTQFYQNAKQPKQKEGDEKDLMLVLVDGCLVCKSGPAGNVQVALVNEWPEGSTFTRCAKEERKPDWYDVIMGPDKDKNGPLASQFNGTLMPDLGKAPEPAEKDEFSSASFAFPLILYQRRCDGLFSADPEENIYKGMKLLVKHSCGGSGSTMEVNLAEIDPQKFKNNMVELRGMMLILDDKKWLQYRVESNTYWNEEDLKEVQAGDNDPGKPAYDNAKEEEEEGKKKRRRRK